MSQLFHDEDSSARWLGLWHEDGDAPYRALFTRAPIAMHVLDERKCIVDVNHHWLALFGYERAEVIGRTILLFQDSPSAARMMADWDAVVSRGTARDMQRRYTCKDGSRLDIMLSCSVEKLGDQTLRSICILTDVTDRKRAETALRESEERFRSAMLHSAIGMALVARDGQFLQVNGALCRITGYSAEELMDLTFQDITHPDDLDADVAQAIALLNGRIASYRMEKRYIRRDGQVVWIQLTGSVVRDPAGEPLYFIAQIENIQERKRTEAALRDSEARLRQAEKMAALGELAGGVAHDFNNVLQAVDGAASLIRSHAADAARVAHFAAMIQDAAQRGSSITHRLLAFARRDELRAEVLDVSALLDSLREMLAHTLGASVAICLDTADALPPILADRGQLESVLINLATNARDAMPEGGSLTFSAVTETIVAEPDDGGPAPGAYVRLAVADTGKGMAPETLARAWEPFFTTKQQGKGTGLGLAMARGFAEQSGGALTIASELGQGTVVTLWLPIALNGAVARPAGANQATSSPAPGLQRILLVDDDALVRELVAAQLCLRGFQVIEAEGAAAALALLQAGEPVDLLISDQSMPDMDGISLIRAAWQHNARLPAILLTGDLGYLGEAAGLANQVGCRRFRLVRKPVTGDQLTVCIASLAEARGAA